MKILQLASFLVVGVAVTAAACGSSDESTSARDAGGEAGNSSAGSSADAGSTSGSDMAGAGPERGGAGGVPSGAAGEASSGAAGEPGAAGAPTLGGASSSAGAGGEGGAPGGTVVDLGFEDATDLPANLDAGGALLTPSQGYAPLGPVGNQFGDTFLRGPTGTIITLTLNDLPPHQTLSLSLLFAAIDSLDGEGTFPAGDYFKITLDGQIVFRESFANAIDTQVQSYDPPAEVVLARHEDLGFGGPGGYYRDSAYDFGLDPALRGISHSASSAVLVFTLEGEGVQSVDDESWAIDNIRVSVE